MLHIYCQSSLVSFLRAPFLGNRGLIIVVLGGCNIKTLAPAQIACYINGWTYMWNAATHAQTKGRAGPGCARRVVRRGGRRASIQCERACVCACLRAVRYVQERAPAHAQHSFGRACGIDTHKSLSATRIRTRTHVLLKRMEYSVPSVLLMLLLLLLLLLLFLWLWLRARIGPVPTDVCPHNADVLGVCVCVFICCGSCPDREDSNTSTRSHKHIRTQHPLRICGWGVESRAISSLNLETNVSSMLWYCGFPVMSYLLWAIFYIWLR